MREWLRRPRPRRLAGAVLVAAGALTIGTVGWRYAEGAIARAAVRRAWEEAEAYRAVARLREAATGFVAEPAPSVGAPVALLVVPRLGIDEVVVEGVEDAQLDAGPGHLPGSAMPGLPGNAVVSAHRDRHFSRLGELRVGDTIRTEYGAHDTVWRVVSRRVVHRAAPALFETREPTLTLTTCWPIRFFGPAPDRLIVTAHPIQPSAGRVAAAASAAPTLKVATR